MGGNKSKCKEAGQRPRSLDGITGPGGSLHYPSQIPSKSALMGESGRGEQPPKQAELPLFGGVNPSGIPSAGHQSGHLAGMTSG